MLKKVRGKWIAGSYLVGDALVGFCRYSMLGSKINMHIAGFGSRNF